MASFALNPSLFQGDTFPDVAGAFVCSAIMEGPFKFLFGSKGRINRAQYWHPHVIFSLAGLFAAATIAARIFIVMVILVFIPWLMWGFASWHLVFYAVTTVLGHLAKAACFAEGTGMLLHYVPALASFALAMWGFVEIGWLRGTAGPNKYGSIPLTR